MLMLGISGNLVDSPLHETSKECIVALPNLELHSDMPHKDYSYAWLSVEDCSPFLR